MVMSNFPKFAQSSLFLTAALGATLLAFAPVMAAGPVANAYEASLAAPAESDVYVVRDTAFRCSGTNCTASKSASSPRMVCARFVREAGPVVAFSYNGEAFDEASLARCNK